MKLKNLDLKKIKINFNGLFRHLYSLTIVIVVIILICVFFFLYKNVYQTLAYAEIVNNLKLKVPEENLEKAQFEKILTQIQAKVEKSTVDFSKIKNPFTPPPTVPRP